LTKLWFKTKNDQIVDLNCDNQFFAIYEISPFQGSISPVKYCVSSNQICDTLGVFDTKEEAQAYLDEIHNLLIGDILYRCDECKKYPPLPPITKKVDSGSKSIEDFHPWDEFLKARVKALKWAKKEMKHDNERIAYQFSMDAEQVRLILEYAEKQHSSKSVEE